MLAQEINIITYKKTRPSIQPWLQAWTQPRGNKPGTSYTTRLSRPTVCVVSWLDNVVHKPWYIWDWQHQHLSHFSQCNVYWEDDNDFALCSVKWEANMFLIRRSRQLQMITHRHKSWQMTDVTVWLHTTGSCVSSLSTSIASWSSDAQQHTNTALHIWLTSIHCTTLSQQSG